MVISVLFLLQYVESFSNNLFNKWKFQMIEKSIIPVSYSVLFKQDLHEKNGVQ